MNHVDLKCARWIIPLVEPARRREAVEKTRRRITRLEFDAVAFTGLSGSVIAGAVVSAMDKYLYCVRKSAENRHSEYQVEGPSTGLRYVVIDDFISTGETIKRIIELVGAHTDGQATCVGGVSLARRCVAPGCAGG
jgi:orotate phosphoribosyltransferase